VSDRINVHREVRRTLIEDEATSLRILPALAGELLASGDEVDVADLKDALGRHLLHEGPNPDVAEAVLAMVRTYTMRQSPNVAY
jgi:hypothetical protein